MDAMKIITTTGNLQEDQNVFCPPKLSFSMFKTEEKKSAVESDINFAKITCTDTADVK